MKTHNTLDIKSLTFLLALALGTTVACTRSVETSTTRETQVTTPTNDTATARTPDVDEDTDSRTDVSIDARTTENNVEERVLPPTDTSDQNVNGSRNDNIDSAR